MNVKRCYVVNLDGLILRAEPQLEVCVVEHALIGLSHGDDFLHHFTSRDEYGTTIGGHTVHQYLQAFLVGLLLNHNVIAEVEALSGGRQVLQVQCELSTLTSWHVIQDDMLGTIVGVAVNTDAYIGLLHPLSTVTQSVLTWVVIFRLLLAFVGVVALTAY